VNFPSTFGIPPGEHMVYSISLNERWKAVPPLPTADETPIPITIIAIYEVSPSPEASKEKVWTGRLESSSYHFKFRIGDGAVLVTVEKSPYHSPTGF